jgi:hypothetical protein
MQRQQLNSQHHPKESNKLLASIRDLRNEKNEPPSDKKKINNQLSHNREIKSAKLILGKTQYKRDTISRSTKQPSSNGASSSRQLWLTRVRARERW